MNQETPALPQAALEYVIDGDREYRQLEAQLHDANERNDGHAIATIHGKLDAIDAWSIRSRAASLLHGLGFSNEQLERPVSDFSGGWRMRLNLAQALICRSDLLLLDEPTNHLDLDAVIWLEKWLKSYQGTLILISHDRDFLDPIVDKIIHIEQQSMFEYTGNYSSFEVQRATRLAQQQAMYESQQERVAHLQSYIDRFRAKATKAKQAQSRIKMLERMELIAPAHVDNPFRFSFRAPESLPNPLLKMEKVSAGYGDRIILDSIKLNLVPGSRIGLLGRNGAGKSTLIKLLAGELAPVSGEIGLAKGIKLGYFAQHQLEYLRADESPIQHLARLAPQELEQKLPYYFRDALAELPRNDKVLRFSANAESFNIPYKDILYLESNQRVVYLYTVKPMQAPDRFYGKMEDLAAELEGDGFLRIQKSYLVNMAYIKKFNYDRVVLFDGKELSVSQKRYSQMKVQYLSWKNKNWGNAR